MRFPPPPARPTLLYGRACLPPIPPALSFPQSNDAKILPRRSFRKLSDLDDAQTLIGHPTPSSSKCTGRGASWGTIRDRQILPGPIGTIGTRSRPSRKVPNSELHNLKSTNERGGQRGNPPLGMAVTPSRFRGAFLGPRRSRDSGGSIHLSPASSPHFTHGSSPQSTHGHHLSRFSPSPDGRVDWSDAHGSLHFSPAVSLSSSPVARSPASDRGHGSIRPELERAWPSPPRPRARPSPLRTSDSPSPVRGRVGSPDEVASNGRAKVLATELAEQLQDARHELDTVRPSPETLTLNPKP